MLPPSDETPAATVAGDAFPSHAVVIKVYIGELRQLFNAIDPSPFRDKDLDPKAEEFIVAWSKEVHRDAPLALLVHLGGPPGPPGEAALLRDAVHAFFAQRAVVYRQRLRELFRRGRISLIIALAFVGASIAIGDLLANWIGNGALGNVVREGVTIIGWVAMWRPLEVFLYDWWPLRSEARLSDRLATMPVRIQYGADKIPEARDAHRRRDR